MVSCQHTNGVLWHQMESQKGLMFFKKLVFSNLEILRMRKLEVATAEIKGQTLYMEGSLRQCFKL